MVDNETSSCDAGVAEKLPWLLNGSLEAEERDAVVRHLGTCSDCRRALEDCRSLGDAAAAHPPIDLLLDAAEGRPLAAEDRALLDAHRGSCAQCSAEWNALSVPASPIVRDRSVPEARFWRPLAIAAAFAALALGLGWWSNVATLREAASPVSSTAPHVPTVAVVTAELVPEEPTRAGVEPDRPPVFVGEDTEFLAVVLLPTIVTTAGFDLTIEGARGWRFDAVEPGADGVVTVLVPADELVDGDYVLTLRDGAASEVFALRVERARRAAP